MRHRQQLVEAAQRVQHMQKSLTQMNLQIQHVLSDVTVTKYLRLPTSPSFRFDTPCEPRGSVYRFTFARSEPPFRLEEIPTLTVLNKAS